VGGVAAITRVASEPRRIAQIFASCAAVRTNAAGGGEPRQADVRAERKTADAGTDRSHPADNLVARHDRQLRIRQFAVDQVQIGAANAAGRNLNQDLTLARLGNRPLAQR
jgi:hypothetical protein